MISLTSAIISASLIASPLGVRAITLEYSTYLGGSSVDSGLGIAVNNAQAFVVGHTYSPDFPTADPYQASLPSIAKWDVFLSAFSSSGSSLIFSTYLGGSERDLGYAIGLDNGEVIIAGYTDSSDFPTRVPYQSSLAGPPDVFVSRLSSSGSQLIFSTFLGGGGADEGYGLAVDNGQAYVTGWTQSTNFPLFAAYQTSYAGGVYDSFVSKFSSDGSQLAFSTYLGGEGIDNANGIAVENGSAFVTGWTQSSDFPVLDPFQASSASPAFYDVFVSKLSTSGSRLLYSTYLGGTDYDYGYGIAVDNGQAYVAGWTQSTNFPLFAAYQTSYASGEYDSFVSKFSSDGS
ncbi:MAG: SBBP repeat-containing protein, partial [Candidatus Aureabacteria bacterium]|nr:SBBP repeat-containing protein [Candidatus Auribacterota bacterium]